MIYGKKPIMSSQLERSVMNAVVMFQKRAEWKKLGLHKLRAQGAAILLEGPPGTGKTRIAEYLSLKVRKKGIKELSFADFGSHIPGENARQIRRVFYEANENDGMTVYLDECDAVLIDRNLLGPSSMWMLEIINELLMQIGKYKFLTILSSNHSKILDKALMRRLLMRISVPRPEYAERRRLWIDKIPEEFPFKFTDKQLDQIATLQLTGAEIETVIINAASDAIRLGKKITADLILQEAWAEVKRLELTNAQAKA